MAKKKVTKKKTPTKAVKKKAPAKGSPNKYKAEEKKNKPDLAKAAKKVKGEPSATSLQGKGILTLLDVDNRKKLPPAPEEPDSKIFDIVKNHQDEYKEFLAYIRDGVSVSSACAGSGMCTYSEVMTMLRRGSQDILRNSTHIEDTYYSRFYIDFSRTAGITVGEAESKVKETDPKFWLRNSPISRIFGESWRDDPDRKVTHMHSGSIEHFLGADPSSPEENPDELLIEGELIAGAIEDLANAGLVTLTADYELAKRIQRGEVISDEEMEALEDQQSTGSDGVLQLDNQGMPLLLPRPGE